MNSCPSEVCSQKTEAEFVKGQRAHTLTIPDKRTGQKDKITLTLKASFWLVGIEVLSLVQFAVGGLLVWKKKKGKGRDCVSSIPSSAMEVYPIDAL